MANEKRLIDANALLEKAYLTHPATMANPYGGDYVVSVEHIENAPTVDAVEVVRCKDCKMLCRNSSHIAKHCTLSGIPVDEDDFCSYGERRTE